MKAEFINNKIEELGALAPINEQIDLFTVQDGLGIILKNPETGNAFPFAVHVEDEHPNVLSDFINVIHTEVFQNKESVPQDLRKEIMHVINVAEAVLIENDVPMQRSDDQRNKIYYTLVTGDQLITDIGSIDWEDNRKNLQNMLSSLNNCKMLINALLRSQPVTLHGENGEATTIPADVHALNEIKIFHENNKMSIDYSVFDLPDVTPREKLIAQLIDVMSVYNELIIHTAVYSAQKDVIAYYEGILAGMQKASEAMEPQEQPAEAKTVETVETPVTDEIPETTEEASDNVETEEDNG